MYLVSKDGSTTRAPAFDRGLMIKEDTEKLALPEGRRVGQPGHEAAKGFIWKRMREIGLTPFNGHNFSMPYGTQFTNLAGLIPGSETSAPPILLGAHYDSAIDAPCADDNAVSVALILNIAEILISKEQKRNTIIAFFDAEERPNFLSENMGSTRFCNDHCREMKFACVVILDSIGHDFQTGFLPVDLILPRIRKLLFILGSESHESLPEIIEKASSDKKQLRVFPTMNKYIGDRSDHHAFRKAGHPYLFLSKGWGKHSHKPEDTVEWINFSRVEIIKIFLLNTLKLIDSAQIDKNRSISDPYKFEIRMIKKAIGWPLPLILCCLGFFRMALHSRKDIDSLMKKVLNLTGYGG